MGVRIRPEWRPPYPGWRPTVIQAVLDLMPSGPPWDADEFEEWFSLFEKACRVYYRIPRPTPAEPETSPSGSEDDPARA